MVPELVYNAASDLFYENYASKGRDVTNLDLVSANYEINLLKTIFDTI